MISGKGSESGSSSTGGFNLKIVKCGRSVDQGGMVVLGKVGAYTERWSVYPIEVGK